MRYFVGALSCIVLGLAGCSTVMEANRPPATNLSKFAIGEKKIDVMAKLGAAKTTAKDEDKSCDVYNLYTTGTSKAGKAGIIFTEAAADFFTVGLAEVVATPAEAASKSNVHVVLFCYSPDETLVSVTDSGRKLPSAARKTQ